MQNKINAILITCLFTVPTALSYEVVVLNEMNEFQIPYIEGLGGLAPDSLESWILPQTNRVYNENNVWLTSGAINVKEGDKREIQMDNANCGPVEFLGKKNVTFYEDNGTRCRVLNTPTLNELYAADHGMSCEDGRVLTEEEFELLNNEHVNLCNDTSIWGLSLIGVEKLDGSIEYITPEDGATNGQCKTLSQTCVESSEKCDFVNTRPKNLLCVANPLEDQVMAYSAPDFSNGSPISGNPQVKINHDSLAGRTVYSGDFSSFKVGENLEVHGFTEADSRGQPSVFKSGIHTSPQKIKSFYVKTAVHNTSEIGENFDSYVSNEMNVSMFANQGATSCEINISGMAPTGAKIGHVFATVAALDSNNKLFKTERVLIPVTYTGVTENEVEMQKVEGSAQVDMLVENGSGLSQCIVSKIEIEHMGRADLTFPENAEEATAAWYEIPGNDQEINNPHHAVQLLAEPLIFIFTGASKPNYNRITSAYSRSEQFTNLRNNIINGSTGITGGYYGFSIDFIELRTREAINEFLLETVINPATKLGVISDDLNNTDFAEELRQEILGELYQDAFHDYGSVEHIKRSIAMMFSNVVPPHLQRNNLTENIYLNMDDLFDINHPYMTEPLASVQDGDVFSSDDNDEEITPLDIYGDLTFSSPNEETRAEAFQQLFSKNSDIIVDYDKGHISNRARQGGYLGQTYLTVAADIYQTEIENLTVANKRIVEMAMLSMGIDTVYPFGSVRNIKSTVLNRVSANVDIPPEFKTHLFSGGAPELLDALEEKLYPGQTETPFDIQTKTLFRDIFLSSNLLHPPPENKLDEIWKQFLYLETLNDALYDLETVIDKEPDGTEFYANALTDEQFTKSIFNKVGISSPEWHRWELFFTSKQAPVPLYRIFEFPETQEEKDRVMAVGKRYCSFLSDYVYKYGARETPQEMWNRHYRELATILGEYAAWTISLKAKFSGQLPWDGYYADSKTIFIAGYETEEKNCSGMGGGGNCVTSQSQIVDTPYSYIANKDWNFSIKTSSGVANTMYLNGLELDKQIDFDLNVGAGNHKNELWWWMNGSNANVCDSQQPQITDYTKCLSTEGKTSFTFTRTGTFEETLAQSFTAYMLSQQNQFKTARFPIDQLINLLKSIVPFWSTIETFQKGNHTDAFFGMLSDAMLFLPMTKLDNALDALGALKPKKVKKGMKFKRPPIGVKDPKGNVTIGGKPDKVSYREDTKKVIPNISNGDMDKFASNVTSSDGLPAKGRPSNSSENRPNRKPEPAADDLGNNNIDSKFTGDKSKLNKNEDGSFTDEDGKTYIQNGEDFYHAVKDKDGNWYLLDKDGNPTEKVKQDGDGKWKADRGVALTENDMIRFGAQKVYISSNSRLRKLGNGMYTMKSNDSSSDDSDDSVNMILVGESYFRAEWDPVYSAVYVYDQDWNRKPLLDPVKKQWYKDLVTAKTCVYN